MLADLSVRSKTTEKVSTIPEKESQKEKRKQ